MDDWLIDLWPINDDDDGRFMIDWFIDYITDWANVRLLLIKRIIMMMGDDAGSWNC